MAFYIVFSLFTLPLCAQNSSYFIVKTSFGVQYTSGQDKWLALHVGDTLTDKNSIRVEEDGGVVLIHSSSKEVLLTKAGTYSFDELSNKLVNRGTLSFSPIAIDMLLDGTVRVAGEMVLIKWTSASPCSTFVVSIVDDAQREIGRYTTTASELKISMEKFYMSAERQIVVSVVCEGDKKISSELYRAVLLGEAERKSVHQKLATINPVNTAQSKAQVTDFFEKQNLLLDAFTAIEDAVRLSKGNPKYEQARYQFIRKNDM